MSLDDIKKFIYDEVQRVSSELRSAADLASKSDIDIKSDSLFLYKKGYKDAMIDILDKIKRD